MVALLAHNPQDDDDLQFPDDVTIPATESAVLETEMVHRHLPKLVDMGFIEWDRDTNEIATGPRFDEIRPLLELMDDHQHELPEAWL